MNNALKSTISKQREEIEALRSIQYVERTKEEKGRKWLEPNLIKVILGPRRAGKSVFALMLLKNQSFAYFNFDEESLDSVNLDELMTELKLAYGNTKYIFFDEIQNVPKWELFANRLHREGYNLLLTGSNALLLSKELATHLTGRHIPIEILPFDFKEILKAKNYEFSKDKIARPEEKSKFLGILNQYMTNGGYPEVIIKDLNPRGYLDVLYDALLFKDVIKRYKIRYSEQISKLGSYLISNIASTHNIHRLANILNFKSDNTLEKYLGYLTEAYLLFSLNRYSAKAGVRTRSPKKIYVVDNGFVAAKAIQHSPDTGKLMENLVFMELVKRGNEPNREIFYYHTRNGREVDFLLRKGHVALELIQVAYEITPDVEQREIKALLEAAKELNVTKLTLLTWSDKREVEKGGLTMHFKPVWEWLLEREEK